MITNRAPAPTHRRSTGGLLVTEAEGGRTAVRIHDYPREERTVDVYFLSCRDIYNALQYLQENDLIEQVTRGQVQEVEIRITERGIRCIRMGEDVTEYVSSSRPGPQSNYVGVNYGNISFGPNAQQNSWAQGGVIEIRSIIQRIVEDISKAELAPNSRERAEGAACQASEESLKDVPDGNRIAAALGTLRGILASAGHVVMVSLIDTVLIKLGLPPGA